MSFKMTANAWFTELCEYEKEINSKWTWKLCSKRRKSLLLKKIAYDKVLLAMSTKIFDCMVQTAENS